MAHATHVSNARPPASGAYHTTAARLSVTGAAPHSPPPDGASTHAPPAPAARPAIDPLPTQLLTAHLRLPRRDLGEWGAEVAAQIESLPGPSSRGLSTPELAHVVACGNVTALLQSYVGDVRGAAATLHRVLGWLARTAGTRPPRGADPSRAALALQPWVNLGRLHCLAGRFERALAHLAVVPAFLRDRAVVLGPVCIDASHLGPDTPARRDVVAVAHATYVADTLRTLLRAGLYDRLGAFTAEVGVCPEDSSTNAIRYEARIVALGRSGLVQDAIAHARAEHGRTVGWDRLVCRVRLAQLLLLAGDPTASRQIGHSLEHACKALCSRARPNFAALLCAQQFARVLILAGDPGAAYALGVCALAGSEAIGDEVLQVELGLLCADTAPGVGAQRAHRARTAAVCARTSYASLRVDGAPGPHAETVGHAAERLHLRLGAGDP